MKDEHPESQPTGEVASEGGTPGDVEIEETTPHGSGSEQTETWRPQGTVRKEIRRDETGEGRRSPQ